MSQPKLITCPACSKDVSSAANSCPACGHPVAGETNAEPGGKITQENKKKSGWFRKIVNGIGCIFLLLVVIGFFVGKKDKDTKENTNFAAEKTDGATKEEKTQEFIEYDRVFEYDVESIALQKIEMPTVSTKIFFQQSLSTDSTYVFVYNSSSKSSKKKYILRPKFGETSSVSQMIFDRVTRSGENVLICETGIKESYGPGDYIYFVKDNRIFLEIDNTPKQELYGEGVGKLIDSIHSAYSDDFFYIHLGRGFYRIGGTEWVAINTQGQVVFPNRFDGNIFPGFGNIAELRAHDGTSSYVNLRTGKPLSFLGASFKLYGNNTSIRATDGKTHFLLDKDGNILSKSERPILLKKEAATTNKESYDMLKALNGGDGPFLLYKKNGKFGLKDFDGKILSEAIFPDTYSAEYAGFFRDYKNTDNVPFIFIDASDSAKFKYITTDGRIINKIGDMEFMFVLQTSFSENLASAAFPFKNSEGFLHGYFDSTFNWVIPPVFDQVTPFKSGTALVEYKSEWLIIRNPLLSAGEKAQPTAEAQTRQTSPSIASEPQYEEVEVVGIVDHPGSSHGSISNADGSMGLGFEMVPEIGHRILAMCPIGSRCKVGAKIDTDTLLVQQILSIKLLSPPPPPKPREQAKTAKSTEPEQTSTPTSSPVPNQSQSYAKPPYFPFSETALVSYLESVKAIGSLTKVENTTANPNINQYVVKNFGIFFLVERDDSGKITSVAVGAGASTIEEFKIAGSIATRISSFIREHNGWTIGKDHEETGKITEFLVAKATKMPKTQERLGTKYFDLTYAWGENNGSPVIVYAFEPK